MSDRRSEGQFRGYLGLLHARLGCYSAARECLAIGEALLVEVSDLLCLGQLLCSRAETEHLAGDSRAARSILRRIEALALETSAGPESELGRALFQARKVIETAD